MGTGKSFFAGCIANALIERDISVLMTNIPSILNQLTGMFAENRAAFISALDDYSLLILDDLGVELHGVNSSAMNARRLFHNKK